MNVSSTIAKFGLTKAFRHLYKDPENNLPQLMDWADKFSKGIYPSQRAAVRAAIEDPDNAYYPYIRHLINDVDPDVLTAVAVNFFINENLIGGPIQDEWKEKYQCNIPWAILLDPTSACNLHCVGCWAAEYGNKLNLSFDEIDDIVRQGKEMGVYMYIYTGGEPLVRKKDLIRIGEDMVIDCTAHQVTIHDIPLNLSPKEYDLLYYLARNRGIALTREKLLSEVWGYDFYGDDRTLDTHIKLLRKELGEYANRITTLRGVGYRFEKD